MPTSKQDAPVRAKSPDAGGSGDEAVNESTARRSSSESSSSSSDDDDAEMAVLMRQAEEMPSSSDDEGEQGGGAQKKVPAHRKKKSRFGRKYDMPVNNLAVIVVAFWTLRLPVTYMDFVRHVDCCATLACQLKGILTD